MYDDINFLEYIYESSKIGQEIIGHMIKLKVDNDEINILLKDHLLNYKKIASSSKTMLERRNKKIKEVGLFSQLVTYMSTKFNVSKDNNNKDIINIICQNSKQGIDEINIKLKESNIKSKSIINLAERYIKFEQENLDKIKKYI